MDWLANYQANLDCAAKTITVNHPTYGLVRYWSPSPKISTTITPYSPETSLYLMEGITPPEMHEVEVVCDFPDIFPEELHGMPPDRSVEFVIELAPVTGPTSRSPYRMSAEELTELEKQLDELLEKEFTRPSSSPWGRPVLFVKKRDTDVDHRPSKEMLAFLS